MTTFYVTRNNVATTTTGYTSGSGSIALASGAGASFGTPSAGAPVVVSTFLADGTPKGIYSCTGRTGDTLTGLTLLSGTDATLAAGARVELRWCAEHVMQLTGAVSALETTVSGYGNVVTHNASEFQPVDADLTALAALSGTGFARRTGSNAWAVGTLATGDIPDLSATYSPVGHTHTTSQITDLGSWAGSTALVTVGTVATGTWHGTPIAVAYLGSGTPAAGKYLDGGGSWTTLPASGSGTVTSVGMTVPGVLFSVSGSPVTTAGTLAFSLLTQTANTVLAGPATGADAAPTMRALVAADVPALDAAKVATGTLATARLGSGTASSSTFLRGDQTWAAVSGGTPGGSATEIQYRSGASTFGAVAGSSWNGTTLVLPLSSSPGSGTGSERFGAGSSATATSTVAIGNGAVATAVNAMAIGAGASCANVNSMAVGVNAVTSGTNLGQLALGPAASCTGGFGTAIGVSASVSGGDATAIGSSATASGIYGMAIGYSASAGHSGALALGVLATTTAANQFLVGANLIPVNSAVFCADSGGFTLAPQALSSTSVLRNTAKLTCEWATSTDASRKGRGRLSACDSTGTDREGLRVESDGSQALLGFYGAAAVAKAASPGTAAGSDATVINAIILILRNLGLCS